MSVIRATVAPDPERCVWSVSNLNVQIRKIGVGGRDDIWRGSGNFRAEVSIPLPYDADTIANYIITLLNRARARGLTNTIFVPYEAYTLKLPCCVFDMRVVWDRVARRMPNLVILKKPPQRAEHKTTPEPTTAPEPKSDVPILPLLLIGMAIVAVVVLR